MHCQCMLHVVAGYVNDDERARNERRRREGGEIERGSKRERERDRGEGVEKKEVESGLDREGWMQNEWYILG